MSEIRERFIRTMEINGRMTYVIADYNFWVEHQDELEEWLENNTEAGLATQEGATLSFANEQEELMFILKWSGRMTSKQFISN